MPHIFVLHPIIFVFKPFWCCDFNIKVLDFKLKIKKDYTEKYRIKHFFSIEQGIRSINKSKLLILSLIIKALYLNCIKILSLSTKTLLTVGT